jgi:hypothetical protein
MEYPKFCDYPDFTALTGSRLYGYHTEKSDYDYRGFVVPPSKYLLGIDNFLFHQKKDTDNIVFSLKHFIDVTLKGNTQTFEILFSNDITYSPIGYQLLQLKENFFSQKIIRSTLGFALSEWRKTLSQALVFEYRDSKQQDILVNLAGTFQLKRDEIKEIYDIIFRDRVEDDPRRYVPNDRIGEKARLDIERYGYQLKPACNTIRLICQAIEFVQTGKITYPRPESPTLKDIRSGLIPYASVNDMFNEYYNKLAKMDLSSLPIKPNHNAIMEWYQDVAEKEIKKDN